MASVEVWTTISRRCDTRPDNAPIQAMISRAGLNQTATPGSRCCPPSDPVELKRLIVLKK
jgi:hypothetical protein